MARLLDRCGWQVSREYYVNDTGGQIRQLGASLLARRNGEPLPEGGYPAGFIKGLAAAYDGPDDVAAAGRWAAERTLGYIKLQLAEINIHYDEWFSQASIEESPAMDETVAELTAKGLVYEEDGALWLRTADFGDPREKRVLRKSDGDWTYLAGDLTYHRNKFARGFDLVINVWGADHEGQVPSLKAGVAALGVDPRRLEIRLGQMISLASGRMGKRPGNAVDLDDLVDDIGPDAMRLLSLVNSPDQATLVDLEKIRAESKESPVFYVQMAYARIAGIGREAREAWRDPRPDRPAVDLAHADPRPGARPAADPVRAARGGGPGLRRAGPAQGDDVGPGAGRPLPRLLPRLLRAALRRARGADPGPAVAGRGGPDRPQHRPRPARRRRPREDVTETAPAKTR